MKKKKLNKIIALLLTAFAAAALLSGCGKNAASDDGKLKVIATIFPLYDWTRKIVGENSDVSLKVLTENGVDIHSFQPSVDDIVEIATCDVFIYVGGESDQWVKDALEESVNENQITVNLMECLGENAKEEEHKEGMEEDHEEDHEGEPETDEHVWLSLSNANLFCEKIAEALSKADAAHGDSYRENAKAYGKQLKALDAEYDSAVANAQVKTVVFGDRFPFRYLFDDYEIDYYAAFNGCSAETEASFETITFLAGKIDELNLKYICTTESSDGKIAETIKNNTASKNQAITALNSMQSVTSESMVNGITYIAIMKENLETLKTVLEVK